MKHIKHTSVNGILTYAFITVVSFVLCGFTLLGLFFAAVLCVISNIKV